MNLSRLENGDFNQLGEERGRTSLASENGSKGENRRAAVVPRVRFRPFEIACRWGFIQIAAGIKRPVLGLPAFRAPPGMRDAARNRKIQRGAVSARLPAGNDFLNHVVNHTSKLPAKEGHVRPGCNPE